jgi:hypothetical protein
MDQVKEVAEIQPEIRSLYKLELAQEAQVVLE